MRTVLVAAIGAFVGVAVSQLFGFTLAPTPTSQTEITLVDRNGVVRFRVWLDDANDVRLGLFDKDGARRAGISVLPKDEGAAVFVQDGDDTQSLTFSKLREKNPSICLLKGDDAVAVVPFVPFGNSPSTVGVEPSPPALEVTQTEFKPVGSKIAYRVCVKNSSDVRRTAKVRAQFVDKSGFMLGFSFADERTIEPGAETWFSETTFVSDGDSTAVAVVEARVVESN